MKNINFKRMLCATVCTLSELMSQQALAKDHSYVLMDSDNKVVGQGQYEELQDSIAKISIKSQGLDFTGTGVVSKRASLSATKGQRPDRAMMAATYQKHVIAELVSSNGSKLECELIKEYSDIWGQCINPSNQQIFSIKTLKDEH